MPDDRARHKPLHRGAPTRPLSREVGVTGDPPGSVLGVLWQRGRRRSERPAVLWAHLPMAAMLRREAGWGQPGQRPYRASADPWSAWPTARRSWAVVKGFLR